MLVSTFDGFNNIIGVVDAVKQRHSLTYVCTLQAVELQSNGQRP